MNTLFRVITIIVTALLVGCANGPSPSEVTQTIAARQTVNATWLLELAQTATAKAPTGIATPANIPPSLPTDTPSPPATPDCDRSYPDICISRTSSDLNCSDIPYRNFKVIPPDPHGFDMDEDGIGCEEN